MNALTTTADGWNSTVRSIRWSPMLVTPAVTCVALVAVRAAAGPVSSVGLLDKAGLALTALAAAFVADDAALEAAPGTPVEVRARLAVRAVVALPVVVLGWLLVLAVHHSVTAVPAAPGHVGPAAPDVVDRAVASVGAGSAALALATLAGRFRSLASPGAAGMGAIACLGVASTALPTAVLAALPPAGVVWPPTVLLAVVTIALATREPLDR